MDILHYYLIGNAVYLFIAWAVLLWLPGADDGVPFRALVSFAWPLTLTAFICVLIEVAILAFKNRKETEL